MRFHTKCGERVTLSNEFCTATRNASEFNHGIVFSAEPLQNDVKFEVKIDQKSQSWSGSIEIGLTGCDPENVDLPASAVRLMNSAWIMSGTSIVKNGSTILEFYGIDLDKLVECDRVGVMRTSEGDMVILINGEAQGVAAENLPPVVYAVVDLYGKCIQVTITEPASYRDQIANNEDCLMSFGSVLNMDNDVLNTTLTADLSELSTSSNASLDSRHDLNSCSLAGGDHGLHIIEYNHPAVTEDKLRFHEFCGDLVRLSNNQRTAERRRPLDEFNNGVVMTHRPLKKDELFEIRLDKLVDKWSGSIEVGITTHDPSSLDFPATMTNMRTGTIMMSGCGILTNGKGTRREYGEFNLDELREGDRVGMMRRSNGDLHYFINGMDQGIAATLIPFSTVWGVIDLYGKTIKVTIVDRDVREEQNLMIRREASMMNDPQMAIGDSIMIDSDCCDCLLFHATCGTHAEVINGGRTAHRPNAIDDFNNGVVLTNRPLKTGELFEVKLDKVVVRWAGSIEIGVTSHSPIELEFPFTMTNVRSGTWMMTGNGVMHNGTTVLDQYGQNLDRLRVGDRVGVMRKESGALHFYVNGCDQGPAAGNVPESVYGVIDLYGQAAQATIVDTSACCSPDPACSNTAAYSGLRFHHVHGKNARICNGGQTALRPQALGEFNDAIVFSSRPLRDGELFEVSLNQMVDRWSGSIELGLTAMRPDDIDLPNTATDLNRDTWMLSGSAVMENGLTMKNGYCCDLDRLTVGTRVGVMRRADKKMVYFLNGVSQGVACTVPANSVFAVVDLYGQCAQVSITSPVLGGAMMRSTAANSELGLPLSDTSVSLQPPPYVTLRYGFSENVSQNVTLSERGRVAIRGPEIQNSLIFTATCISIEELSEITILRHCMIYAGSIRFGVTTYCPRDVVPPNIQSIPADYWYLTGSEVRTKNRILHCNFCPSLDWLQAGDTIGLKLLNDNSLKVFINSEEMGVAATNLPDDLYIFVELYGSCTSVLLRQSKQNPMCSPMSAIGRQDSLELTLDPIAPIDQLSVEAATTSVSSDEKESLFEFHENHGRNIQLTAEKLVARRVASYNQGVVVLNKPLLPGKMIEIVIDEIDTQWCTSLICGLVFNPPDRLNCPVTALSFRRPCCIVANDWLSLNGNIVRSNYGQKLAGLKTGSKVGLLLTDQNRLQIFINGTGLEALPYKIPSVASYAVFDLYGQCVQISLLNPPCVEVEVKDSTEATSAPIAKPDLEKGDAEAKEKESILNESCLTQASEAHTESAMNSSQSLEDEDENEVKCEQLMIWEQLKKMLFLPDEYFLEDQIVCFCKNCSDGSAPFETDCPKAESDFSWVRIPVRIPGIVQPEKWHTAYYGCAINVIRAVLDRGRPLTKEQAQWHCLINLYGDDNENGSPVIFHPSADDALFSAGFSFTTDKKDNVDVRVVFQLSVRPGSYSVARNADDRIEWGTKESGAIIVSALMAKLKVY